jgi:glycosyltransferase involved in cell wall biosynthesis
MNYNATPHLSLVIAVYNEEECVEELYSTVSSVMRSLGKSYEILFVDDGSKDSTLELLKAKLNSDPFMKVIEFTRNFGQAAAFCAGFTYARGEIILTLDGDLQNDPADIPRILEKIYEGHMVVGGIRINRKDSVRKRIISFFVNRTNKILTGVTH